MSNKKDASEEARKTTEVGKKEAVKIAPVKKIHLPENTVQEFKATDREVAVTRTVDTGKALHHYYIDPKDKKEKRIIQLKPQS